MINMLSYVVRQNIQQLCPTSSENLKAVHLKINYVQKVQIKYI